ncbi:DNA-binding protein [Polychytrium aggregatum]|uniref:DNA-binding protein n=1 Tax=Polychytrium aggregatum TaxID=110093 RepID=UPI0022FE7FB4|nr:DNA-binding protein [Polychytrium aggregatum]KAI9204272.1 DNA-binding protein [Polychytrium aggregatum]
MSLQSQKPITLRGSAQIVVEFFEYGIHTILYQRGIYPAEDFKSIKKYGQTLLVNNDDNVKAYLKQILIQLEKWIMAKTISKLVLVISSKETREVLERWQFDIDLVKDDDITTQKKSGGANKTEKEINMEISAIMRNITASGSFLPMIDEPCTFNVLAYTEKDAEVPTTWVDSDPKIIENAEQVRLRSFSTNIHKVDSLVAYKVVD